MGNEHIWKATDSVANFDLHQIAENDENSHKSDSISDDEPPSPAAIFFSADKDSEFSLSFDFQSRTGISSNLLFDPRSSMDPLMTISSVGWDDWERDSFTQNLIGAPLLNAPNLVETYPLNPILRPPQTSYANDANLFLRNEEEFRLYLLKHHDEESIKRISIPTGDFLSDEQILHRKQILMNILGDRYADGELRRLFEDVFIFGLDIRRDWDTSLGHTNPLNIEYYLLFGPYVPRNGEDRLLSVGSIFHDCGICKPCAFFNNPRKAGCENNHLCLFCHNVHEKLKKPPRPSKNRRRKKDANKDRWPPRRHIDVHRPIEP